MRKQQSIIACGPEPERKLAQWFTKPPIARALVDLVRYELAAPPVRVLEPSAGNGALVRAVRAAQPRAHVTACELDPRWREELEAHADVVRIGDYLEQPRPAQLYDVGVSNPPFDGGQEGEHVAKLLDEVGVAALLLPTRSLHGRERYGQIWYRFDGAEQWPEWAITKRVHMITRPKFAKDGGTDEIVLLRCERVPTQEALGDSPAGAWWRAIVESTSWL